MTWWIIGGGYLLGTVYTARRVALHVLEEDANRITHDKWLRDDYARSGKPLIDMTDRILAAMLGFCAGLLWPISLAVLWVAIGLRVPSEIAEDERRELERLRKLAREHGLSEEGL